jgi:hypothetical protein
MANGHTERGEGDGEEDKASSSTSTFPMLGSWEETQYSDRSTENRVGANFDGKWLYYGSIVPG